MAAKVLYIWGKEARLKKEGFAQKPPDTNEIECLDGGREIETEAEEKKGTYRLSLGKKYSV